jgi:hypothetical protein
MIYFKMQSQQSLGGTEEIMKNLKKIFGLWLKIVCKKKQESNQYYTISTITRWQPHVTVRDKTTCLLHDW